MVVTEAIGLTISEKHRNNNAIVVGADLLLETISQFLAAQKVSAGAQAYVFDRSNRLIVHSDPAIMQGLLTAFGKRSGLGDSTVEAHDPALKAVRRALAEKPGETELFRFEHDHERYIALAAPITFSSLLDKETLVLTAPLSDFTGESDRLLHRTFAVSGTLLLIGFVASLMASRFITRSLQALTVEAAHLGDLEEHLPHRHVLFTSLPRRHR